MADDRLSTIRLGKSVADMQIRVGLPLRAKTTSECFEGQARADVKLDASYVPEGTQKIVASLDNNTVGILPRFCRTRVTETFFVVVGFNQHDNCNANVRAQYC